jgi:hypothetical protein
MIETSPHPLPGGNRIPSSYLARFLPSAGKPVKEPATDDAHLNRFLENL